MYRLCKMIYGIFYPQHQENKKPVSISFIKKVISGGQTGVDRAALKIAKELGIPHGGWCPYKRNAEDGIVPLEYQLEELLAPTAEENLDPDATYKSRTKLNVQNSDGTLVILKNHAIGGTAYTIKMAKELNKPYFIINIRDNPKITDVVATWIIKNNLRTLNIAGPRETQEPGIYEAAYNILQKLLNHPLLTPNKDISTLTKTEPLRAKL